MFGEVKGFDDLNDFWFMYLLVSVVCAIVLINITIAKLSNKYTELEDK